MKITLINGLRDFKGRFVKGKHNSPATEFKKGQHWRNKKPYWDYEWLYNEYIIKGKSSSDIGKENNCRDNNILYFLKKHKIKTRNISEARKLKYWGQKGRNNPMFNRRNKLNPNWKGGLTNDERILLLAKIEGKEWRKSIFNRDKWICLGCNNNKGHFHAHHILSFTKYPQFRLEIWNGLTLCRNCHIKIHSKEGGKEMLKIELIQNHVIEALKHLPNESIDTIITSPPY